MRDAGRVPAAHPRPTRPTIRSPRSSARRELLPPALETVRGERCARSPGARRRRGGRRSCCCTVSARARRRWEAQLDGAGRPLPRHRLGRAGLWRLGPACPGTARFAPPMPTRWPTCSTGSGSRGVHLLGHSLGGLIAASFAARHPGRLISVTLSDAAAGYLKSSEEIRVGRLQARIAGDDHARPGGGRPAPRPRGAVARRARRDLREGLSRCRAGCGPTATSRPPACCTARTSSPTRRRSGRRALVMYGSEDRVTPEAIGRDIAAAIPGARYLTLPGLGHASYVEGPDAFNAALHRLPGRSRMTGAAGGIAAVDLGLSGKVAVGHRRLVGDRPRRPRGSFSKRGASVAICGRSGERLSAAERRLADAHSADRVLGGRLRRAGNPTGWRRRSSRPGGPTLRPRRHPDRQCRPGAARRARRSGRRRMARRARFEILLRPEPRCTPS